MSKARERRGEITLEVMSAYISISKNYVCDLLFIFNFLKGNENKKNIFSTEYLFSVCLYIYILLIYKRQEKRFNSEKDSYDFLESSHF